MKDYVLLGLVLLLTPGTFLLASLALAAEPIDIGSRLEPMVDNYLIERLDGAKLSLHEPVPREIALIHDQPWEGDTSGYHTVFQDGDLYRMYYRGSPGGGEKTCYAESTDGIVWIKPELGLFEFKGSKANNIIWTGEASHNFAPFKDTNPDCKPQQRYKALGYMSTEVDGRRKMVLGAFRSADGIRWSPMHDKPVITQGAFDSLNTALWDAERGRYVAFVRHFKPGVGRDIMAATSTDFINWTEPASLEYPGSPPTELYTNGIVPYERAPHIFFGFPMRYMRDRYSWGRLRDGARQPGMGGVTDGVFMTSRDGLTFHRWDEALVRPGLQRDRWVTRNNLTARGLLTTQSDVHGGPELSLYSTEGYYIEGTGCRLRRFTVRVDGFVSVQAGSAGGEMLTKPLVFSGAKLQLNFSTSAAGSLQVEIQDAAGTPIKGFTLDECPQMFDDRLDQVVTWEHGGDVSHLAGKPIRLRFVLKDADLYSLRFLPQKD